MEQFPKIKEQLHGNTEQVNYEHGRVLVAEYGEVSSENNSVLIVPGFTEGLIALNNFAKDISQQGGRHVIFTEQPKSKPFNGLSALDDQAEAIIAVIEHKKLTNEPLDVVMHSMGSQVFLRAAELAKERGYSCFEPEKGSKSAMVAPAGFFEDETKLKLAGRFMKRNKNIFVGDEKVLTKTTPNGKEIGAGGPKSLVKRPIASSKEALMIARERAVGKLGDFVLKPQVFIYANDELYGWDKVGEDMEANIDLLSGVSTPINPESPGAVNKQQFAEKTGLSGKELKEAWAKNHSNASHNDLLFMPQRTVQAVLQYLDS